MHEEGRISHELMKAWRDDLIHLIESTKTEVDRTNKANEDKIHAAFLRIDTLRDNHLEFVKAIESLKTSLVEKAAALEKEEQRGRTDILRTINEIAKAQAKEISDVEKKILPFTTLMSVGMSVATALIIQFVVHRFFK